MIADPLTLLQCCPIADGAAAAIVAPRTPGTSEVVVRSSVLRSGRLWDHRSEHVWGFNIIRDTKRPRPMRQPESAPTTSTCWSAATAFTIGEIVTTEALGLAPLGEGARLLHERHTHLGGPQPVNPSGGLLLDRGHPLGATGLAQVAEIVWQLQGRAGGQAARPEPRSGWWRRWAAGSPGSTATRARSPCSSASVDADEALPDGVSRSLDDLLGSRWLRRQ